MGWVGISINIATVMVASVALGVVDDDTVHFLHRVRHELSAGATRRNSGVARRDVGGARRLHDCPDQQLWVCGLAFVRVQALGVVRRSPGSDARPGIS